MSTHSRRVCRVPHCEYIEYPSAGAPEPPPPTVGGVDDTSTPPHGDTAAHTAGVLCAFRAGTGARAHIDAVCPRAALAFVRTAALLFAHLYSSSAMRCDAMQAPPTPSRAIPQRTLMAPVRRCSRTRSQRRQVRPLRLLRQAVQRVGSRDVSPAAAALPSF